MARGSVLRLSVVAAGLVMSLPAHAADVDVPPPPPPPAPEIVDNSGSCLYMRADGGGATYERPDVTQPIGVGFAGGGASAINESISDTAFVEGGFGCQFTPSLRGEIVGGYRLRSSLKDPADSLDAKLQTYTVSVNFLYDITNYGGWTPYIGGGLGAAYHRLSDFSAPADAVSGDDVHFTWNVQAGVSYDITKNFKIDAGYRFSDLGNATSSTPNPVTVADMYVHEFKLGLRLHFSSW